MSSSSAGEESRLASSSPADGSTSYDDGSQHHVAVSVTEEDGGGRRVECGSFVEEEPALSLARALAPTASTTFPSMVSYIEPFSTLAGPGLFLHFNSPTLLEQQQQQEKEREDEDREVLAASLPSLYAHQCFTTLAAFCTETTMNSRHLSPHRAGLPRHTSPFPHFWREVGDLSTFYGTSHRSCRQRSREEGTDGTKQLGCGSSGHQFLLPLPTHAAVELVQPSHRQERDLCISLYQEQHPEPQHHHHATYATLTSIVITGKAVKGRVTEAPHDSRPPLSAVPSRYFSAEEVSSLVATSSTTSRSMVAGVGWGGSATTTTTTAAVGGVLYPALRPTRNGGFAAIGMFPPGPSEATVVPPWSIVAMVSRFSHRLCEGGHHLPAAAAAAAAVMEQERSGSHPSSLSNGGGCWEQRSFHYTVFADALAGDVCEVVCAPPRWYPQFYLPAHLQRTGLPSRSPQYQRGPPTSGNEEDGGVLALKVEVRQRSERILSGVFYYSPVWRGAHGLRDSSE